MKSVICTATGQTEVAEVPVPAIGPGEMLIKVWGCGLCSSDVMKVFSPEVPKPVQLGHEVSGEIAEIGEGVQGWAVGERVGVCHHVPCFACQYCKHGNHSMCRQFKASNFEPGGFSEYIRLSAPHVKHNTIRLPDEVSDLEGAFTEPLACCIRGIKRGNPLIGDTVMVVGVGVMGLMLLQLLRLRGAPSVAVDLRDDRLAMAAELGATYTANPRKDDVADLIQEISDGRGCDLAILTVTPPGIFEQTLQYVRDGGTLLIFGTKVERPPISAKPWTLFSREIAVTTSYSPSPIELQEGIDLIRQGAVKVEPLATHQLPFQSFDQALELSREQTSLKIVIRPAGL